MNTLTGIFFLVLSLLAVPSLGNEEWDAQSAYADSDLKEEVHQKSVDCIALAKPDPIDVALFFIRDVCDEKASSKPATRCWVSCVMNKINVLNVTKDGKSVKGFFDRFNMKEKVNQMKGAEETKASFLQTMENCAAQAEAGSKIPCEMGYEMLRCYCRSLKQNKSKPAPRQGEGIEPFP